MLGCLWQDYLQQKIILRKELPRSLKKNNAREHYKIYNIGNNKTESLLDFITTIEEATGKKAIKETHPVLPVDVPKTYADITPLIKEYNYFPSTNIEFGIQIFIN
jgi:UDP-glucuronate 4-epimerase